ncbi:hypothetical protein ACFRJ9_07840 [Paenarthrobacter sp. NPDC056912]|uniref:hypothetical protein n=1 Tax=Paenarthrobacter sp. NPDC056912 TaxID=3345965 RepID=UPI00366E9665
MTRDHILDASLRTLDAADPLELDAGRARADLRRILATDAPAARHTGRAAAAPRPRTGRKVALLGGVAAAVTAGLIVLPALSGGDPAFATWTGVPSGMTGQERADAAAECRSSKRDTGGGMHAGDLAAAEVAISERRGAWTTVVLSGTGGFSALCITDDSFHLFGRSMIGAIGSSANDSTPGPRELTAMALGTGTMGAGNISLAAGEAGSDVAGISYKSGTHQDVVATVSKGRFAFWMPGDELRDTSSDGVEVVVTYRDGTTGTSRLSL